MSTDIKKHIDAARQVLVGVVPNPTSQIDQITNALIYKFMDDMDQAAIKAGGDPSFFVGDLEKYAWTRLMDARVGNQERMNMYVEALVKFSQSKNLPVLFRDIFKSAFLPYRSPEVLGLFLREISFFDYSHPEELGNAYEYLLSIMGSQGDAGQFRTPRHIIDFIVDVVNPTKNDKILDPACGTGGFLVKSFQHILEQHDGKDVDGFKNKEKPLTPDERKKLMENFEGYDIDPGMVRIAQVNMYLHQFKNPKIVQYDSLGMDERWGDKFDVILANPPFMSPKGGVMPHNKFSIKSSRSEVLFVDYILNHLRPRGRAGIIVPEGIIFQSGTAHKQLRKNLVEDGLYAVVSLPSGVFAPYSGVKTSILLFNNELAKTNQEILFVKIESDGFDLSAQRRANKKDDLLLAREILSKWNMGGKVESKLAVYVEKSKIAENGDYNLSGDRYRIVTDYSNAKWQMVELGELEKEEKIEFLRGQGISKSDISEDGKSKCIHYGEIYTIYDPIIKNVASKTNFEGKILSEKGDTLVPATTTADALGIAVARSLNEKGVILGGDINIIRTRNKYILSDYLAYLISNPPLKIELSTYAKGANILHLSNSDLRNLQIPFPPLEIQEQIVAKLDGYAGIIAGAKQIAQNWKPKIEINPEWEKVKLGEVVDLIRGVVYSKADEVDSNGYKILRAMNITLDGDVLLDNVKWISNKLKLKEQQKLKEGDIFICLASGSKDHIGKVAYIKTDTDFYFGGFMGSIRTNNKKAISRFIYFCLRDEKFNNYLRDAISGANINNLNSNILNRFEIYLPPLTIQKQIVEKIEAEHTLIESAKKLIEIYEQKTKEAIAKLWNK